MVSESKQRKAHIYLAAGFTIFLWASAFPAVKYSLEFFSPESIMLFRFLVASLTLAVIAAVKKAKLPEKRDLPLFAAGGFAGIFLYMWLFNTGTNMVASGVSSFVIASAPVFTALLSLLILKEKVKPACWAGVFISFLGLILIAVSQTSGFSINLGVLLLIGAALATSFHNIIQRQILKKYTPLEATSYSMFFATLFMLVFLPGLLREVPKAGPIPNMVIVYLGIFPAALAYLSWGYALSKSEKTAHVTMFLYLTPFVATIIAFFWLGETLSFLSLLGGVVIISGMVLSNKLGKEAPVPAPEEVRDIS